MRSKRRFFALLLAFLFVMPQVRAEQVAIPEIEPVPADIKQLLTDYGRAWASHDPELLRGTLSSRLLEPETKALGNATNISFRIFRVSPTTQFSGDLAYARIRTLYPRTDVKTFHVRMATAIENESSSYVQDGAFTFIKDGPTNSRYGGWRLGSTHDLDVLGFFSPHELWDDGPVLVIRSEHFLFLTHPNEERAVRRWVPIAERAFSRSSAFWSGSEAQHIVVVVPSTTAELGRIVHDTADIGKFVAFVAANDERATGWSPTGPRMFVHTGHLLNYSPGGQLLVLAHELVHALTRAASGPNVPTWIEEGVAQVGSGSPPFGSVRAGPVPDDFPSSDLFVTGSVQEINAAYNQSQAAIQVLVDRFGRHGFARFYRYLGNQRVAVGTEKYHVRRAVAEALHWSYDEWLAAWRKKLA